MAKPSIVFVHGIWADGSSFGKVIPTLQAEGHEVIAAQDGLDTALAHDEDETSHSQQNEFPVTDVFSRIEVADGRVWMLPDGVACFAGDLSDQEQKVVWATHAAPAADLFNQKMGGTALRYGCERHCEVRATRHIVETSASK